MIEDNIRELDVCNWTHAIPLPSNTPTMVRIKHIYQLEHEQRTWWAPSTPDLPQTASEQACTPFHQMTADLLMLFYKWDP